MAAAAAALLVAGGCVPSFSSFHYLSLAGVDGIEVLETGVVDVPVLFHEPMPMRYRLTRDAYSIEFELSPSRSHPPAIMMKATGASGLEFPLRLSREDRCASWRFYDAYRNMYDYIWSSEGDCALGSDEASARQVIGLVVRDGATGDVAGREELPFKIVRNGVVIGTRAPAPRGGSGDAAHQCVERPVAEVYGNYVYAQYLKMHGHEGDAMHEKMAQAYIGRKVRIAPDRFEMVGSSIDGPVYQMSCYTFVEGEIGRKYLSDFWGFGKDRPVVDVLRVYRPDDIDRRSPHIFEVVGDDLWDLAERGLFVIERTPE